MWMILIFRSLIYYIYSVFFDFGVWIIKNVKHTNRFSIIFSRFMENIGEKLILKQQIINDLIFTSNTNK